MPPKWTYFSDTEVEGLNEDFVAKLDLMRKFASLPFVITSGLRTPEKNLSVVGAVPDSSHLVGLAVDLRVENNHETYLIIAAGLAVGITRYGIYIDENNTPTHLHVDDDKSKPQEVIWIKREGQANTAPVST